MNVLQNLLDRVGAGTHLTKYDGKDYRALHYNTSGGVTTDAEGEFMLDYGIDIIRLLELRDKAAEIEAALTLKLIDTRSLPAKGEILISDPDSPGALLLSV